MKKQINQYGYQFYIRVKQDDSVEIVSSSSYHMSEIDSKINALIKRYKFVSLSHWLTEFYQTSDIPKHSMSIMRWLLTYVAYKGSKKCKTQLERQNCYSSE